MAAEVATILVPRTDKAGQQQHTPTAAHAVSPMPLASPNPLSPLLSPKLPKPTDPVELAAAIRKQVEFYFSDANLPTDKHLLKQISKDPEGYVPLKMIANFKRVKGLTKELSVVTEALKGSSMLAVDEEGSRVRRTTPLPTYDTTDICRRTVVAEHLPDKPTIESVTQLFAKYGDVVMVRICSRGGTGKLPSWLNKAVEDINMGVGHGEFALIEFGTEDECVACVTKTKNLDNWRTSLRVRHLLPSFKLAGKGTSKGGRSSETGEGSHGGHHPHQHSHGHSSHVSSGGGAGRRSMDGSLLTHTPGAYQPPSRRSLEFARPALQQQHTASDLSPASSGGGSEQGATAATASAAAAAATAGLPMHLAPIRTQPNSSGGGSKAGSSAGGPAATAALGRLPGSPSTTGGAPSPRCAGSPIEVGSPMKAHLAGLGGSIGSPRSVRSPAPPEVASLIDGILAAPTGGAAHTASNDGQRNSSSGRWSSGSGLGIEVDRTAPHHSTPVASPAAAVAAALAGVMTPPQSGTPRVSTSSTPGRESLPGGLRTPTRMSAAGAAAAAAAAAASGGGGSSGGGSLSPMAPHLAAQAAAAAAMVSSPKASSASNWRSGANTPTASSMPGTPLSNTLSISAGAAVGAELDAWSPPASAGGAFSVGSPNLSGGAAGKPAPWVPASRLAHHQRMAAGSSDGGGSAGAGDTWRSGGGSRPPRGSMPSSSGGGSSGGGARQRRKSWHATEAEEAAAAAGSSAAAAGAAAAVADGSTSDSSSSVRKAGSHRSSRLGQAGDYHATIEAIREASCELDTGMVGRAIAALSSSGRRQGSSSGGGGSAEGAVSPEGGDAADGDGEAAGKRRRARHRRSRSSGSRRQSMDDARSHAFSPEVPSSGGVGAVGLSPRAGVRHGPLAGADDGHHRHHQRDKHSSSGGGSEHHHSHGSGARGSSAGGHSHGGDSTGKKKEKKDYAAWAAATPEFRAAATAAKHSSSGGGAGGPANLAALSTSPARSPMMSPMRGAGGAFSQQAPGSPLPVHGHHLEHTARGPDGTRGFCMGRGRPLTPAAP